MISTSIYQPITPTYLYIKQHSVTKKKYFGKTVSKDPYKYNGSGVYWNNHINKHGKEHIETLWVSDLYYDASIVEVALQFSFDNNIVESTEWANMEPENGLNGGVPGKKRSEESKAKQSASTKGVTKSEETKRKMRVPKPPRTAEHIANHSASLIGVPRGPRSQEAKDNMSAAKTGVPNPNFFSMIETRKTYCKGNLSRWYPEFKQYY